MQIKKTTVQEKFRAAAENAVFLIEGWESLGQIEGKLTYRGRVGPWEIVLRTPDNPSSESCRVESRVTCDPTEENPEPVSVDFSPSFARTALKRACFDENRRALHPPRVRAKTTKRKR